MTRDGYHYPHFLPTPFLGDTSIKCPNFITIHHKLHRHAGRRAEEDG
jgi:hypothetical protein